MRDTKGRHGITLIEVLVAIFVMALGMLALLALFPVGALSMAKAIEHDRATICAGNAAAADNIWGIRFDPQVVYDYSNPSETGPPPPAPPVPFAGTPQVPTSGPGYPVFVDPWAVQLYSPLKSAPSLPAYWVGGMDGTTFPYGIRRQSVGYLNDSAVDPGLAGPAYRNVKLLSWSFLLDDMAFLSDGTYSGLPCAPPGAGAVQRENRYSWAYLCRIPDIGSPSVIDMSVVVFSGRAPALDSAGAMQGEHTFAARYNTVNNVVTVTWAPGSQPPSIRKGGWVLDATINYDPTPPPVGPIPLTPTEIHGFFYRVTNVTDPGLDKRVTPPTRDPNSIDLEIQGSLRGFGTLGPAAVPGYVIIMDNVVDVFQRNTVTGVR